MRHDPSHPAWPRLTAIRCLQRAVLMAAVLGACAVCVSPPARSMPAAGDVARRYAEAIVEVEGASGESQGFFVSSTGLLCTVLPRAHVGDAVTVHGEGDAASGPATVVAVDDDGLALVQLSTVPASPLTALGLSPDGRKTRWLVGLSREARGVQGVVGGDEATGMLVPVPRGAPVLTEKNAVIAVALRRRGGGTIDSVPVARVQTLAQRYRTEQTATASPSTATTATTTPPLGDSAATTPTTRPTEG